MIMRRLFNQNITTPPCGQGKSHLLLLSRPALLVMAALILVGCSPQPTLQAIPSPQATPPPQASSTPTPVIIVPQAATSVPTQQRSVSGTAYVAYASGLATKFTKGDICSLEKPFVLEGNALPISSGLIANFKPTDSTHGGYNFTNNILSGGCVDTSIGTYAVTLYSPSEGDIIMTGGATRVCGGVSTVIDSTEFRVAIRAATGIACP